MTSQIITDFSHSTDGDITASSDPPNDKTVNTPDEMPAEAASTAINSLNPTSSASTISIIECDSVLNVEIDKRRNYSVQLLKCPNVNCAKAIDSRLLLAHFLYVHGFADDIDDLCFEQTVSKQFDAKLLFSYTISCIAILLYAGAENRIEMSPVLSGLCQPNSGLHAPHKRFKYFLPIFVIASNLMQLSTQGNFDKNDEQINLCGICLLSPIANKSLMGTISISDEAHNNINSLKCHLLPLDQIKITADFIMQHSDVLRLSMGSINQIIAHGSTQLILDISIQEAFQNNEL